MNRRIEWWVLVLLVGALMALITGAGLAAGADFPMVRLETRAFPEFTDDLNGDRLVAAAAASIEYYRKLPPDRAIAYGTDSYPAAQLVEGLTRFIVFHETGPSHRALKKFMQQHAAVYAHVDSHKPIDVLFTGYFEPELAGNRTRSDRFPHPVYRRPRDLVNVDLARFASGCTDEIIGRHDDGTLIPYYDRKTIDSAGVLDGQAEVVAWVSDPVGLFFLHVQGSGKVRLEDGEILNVHYDITNGLPYRSIGKYLIDKGALKKGEVSMQTIRDYILAHPEEQEEIFHYNPRYVFFRTRPHGAVGCLGAPLTPGRSVALDRAGTPAGSLLFIRTQKPVCDAAGKIEEWTGFSRFAVNQDTGAAIRGPARADIFWGSGAYAESAAGYLQHPGNLYYIVIMP